MDRSLLGALRETLMLRPRWPALLALAVLAVQAAAVRWMRVGQIESLASNGFGSGDVAALYLPSILVPFVVSPLLMLLLARTMLVGDAHQRRILWGHWIGLYLLHVVVSETLTAVFALVVVSNFTTPFAMTYGNVIAGGVADIAVFSILVRAFLAAAGEPEPRIGATFAAAFGPARFAYFWYAVCAVLFPVLMVFAFRNLLGPGNVANELPGNLAQSAITAIGSLLQFLFAIVAARSMLPPVGHEAEVFA